MGQPQESRRKSRDLAIVIGIFKRSQCGVKSMFTSKAIGFVSSSYTKTSEIPKGPGAKHEAEGVLKIAPEFAAGLQDVEGFSHLFVLWEFNKSEGFDLLGRP